MFTFAAFTFAGLIITILTIGGGFSLYLGAFLLYTGLLVHAVIVIGGTIAVASEGGVTLGSLVTTLLMCPLLYIMALIPFSLFEVLGIIFIRTGIEDSCPGLVVCSHFVELREKVVYLYPNRWF